jgi:hypothetical protein
MKLISRSVIVAACAAVIFALSPAPSAQQGAEKSAEKVAAIKQWLAQSKAQLKNYQWMETTVVSMDGDVKSTKVANCYYDVTGTLQKEPASASPAPEKKRGIRGAIIADKTEELTDYMQKAVALVKTYIPPNSLKIQASKDAGKMTIDMLPGGQNVRLNFHDYEMPGDNLSVSMDTASNRLLGLGVATYIDNPKDAVTLAVTLGSLPDGTGYANEITLNAASKKLTVTVTNTGYRKAGN